MTHQSLNDWNCGLGNSVSSSLTQKQLFVAATVMDMLVWLVRAANTAVVCQPTATHSCTVFVGSAVVKGRHSTDSVLPCWGFSNCMRAITALARD